MRQWNDPSMTPLASINCLAFNHQDFLEDAFGGFLSQKTSFPFEILVHDDASTDKTPEIIREYEAAYPNIIKPIYQTQNQYSRGVRISDTFQFPRARGKYIAMCEGDDYWVDPLKLQIQVDFLEQNPSYAVCYTDCTPFDEHGLVQVDFLGARRDLEAVDLQRGAIIFTLTACFRNVVQAGPRDFACAEYGDVTVWTRLGDHGKGKYLPQIKPSMYRIHGGGVHSRQSELKREKMRFNTTVALLLYRLNRGERKIAAYFATEVIIQLVRNLYPELRSHFRARAIAALRRRVPWLTGSR